MVHFVLAALVLSAAGSARPADPAEVPFRVSYGDLVVQVRIGDRPLWFALDSGSWISFIDPSIARRLPGLREKPNTLDPSMGKSVATLPTLTIGSASIRGTTALESNYSAVGEAVEGTSARVAGVLGYNALKLLSLGVDFDHRRAWVWGANQQGQARSGMFGLANPGRFLTSLSVSPTNKVPMCGIVFGGVRRQACLDLGSYLSFIAPAWARAASSHLSLGPMYSFGGIRGEDNRRLALLDSYRVGNATWEELPAGVSDPKERASSLVGWTTLASLGRVLLDFPSGGVWCRETGSRHRFVDVMLEAYGARIDGDELIANGTVHIPLASIRSIFGISVSDRQGLDQLRSAVPKADRVALLRKFMDLNEEKVAYIQDGRAHEIVLLPGWSASYSANP